MAPLDPSFRSKFIAANLPLTAVPALPEIRLHTAHPGSGLARLADSNLEGTAPPPYWAFPWSGGAALARFLLDRPETVIGRRVLDLGAGSGLVAIAAAKAGAIQVIAAEVDPNAIAAIALNAAANGVVVSAIAGDLTVGPPPDVDVVAVGDLFYAADLAARVALFLEKCLAARIAVLIGDPGRAYLPRSRLRLLAEYKMAEVGETRLVATTASAVFAFEAAGN